MGLSEADYKKYKAILQAKRQITKNQKSSIKEISDRAIGDFGETEVKQLCQVQKRLSPEEITMVVQGYVSGKTIYELAEQFGCHRRTIANLLKKNNTKIDKCRAQKKLNANEVIAMYTTMHSSTEIGKKFGVHPQAVLRCLRSHGVKIRSRGNRAHDVKS